MFSLFLFYILLFLFHGYRISYVRALVSFKVFFFPEVTVCFRLLFVCLALLSFISEPFLGYLVMFLCLFICQRAFEPVVGACQRWHNCRGTWQGHFLTTPVNFCGLPRRRPSLLPGCLRSGGQGREKATVLAITLEELGFPLSTGTGVPIQRVYFPLKRKNTAFGQDMGGMPFLMVFSYHFCMAVFLAHSLSSP